MMKKFGILLVAGLMVLSVGCTSVTKEQSSTPEDKDAPVESIKEGTKTVEEEADYTVDKFIKAVNEGDTQAITAILKDESPTPKHISMGLDNYSVYFKSNELIKFDKIGPHPLMENTIIYIIEGKNALVKEILVSNEDGNIRIIDDIFIYSYAADQYLSRFTKAISEVDHNELIDLLTYDGGPYPDDKAKSIIKSYEEKLGNNPLRYTFKDFNTETRMLEYIITADNVNHTVYILCGDGGLVAIEDTLVP